MTNSQKMNEIIRDVQAGSNPHWFSTEAMAFFNSHIEGGPWGLHDRHNIRFFITSERPDYSYPQRYTIRAAVTVDGDTTIKTVGAFMAYDSFGEAQIIVSDLMDRILDNREKGLAFVYRRIGI